jgi:hypothetical protein
MVLSARHRGSTVAIGEVASLDHEVLDNAVERGTFISKTFLAGGEGAEVLSGLGRSLAVEANYNAAHGLVAMCDVKVDLSWLVYSQ